MLVYFQRINGQSYLLWNFGQRMGLSLKLVLLFLNIILFMVNLYYTYIGYEDSMNIIKNNKAFASSHKFSMPLIMQISLYILFTIMNVFVFVLILFSGKTILAFLYNLDISIDSGIERKIGIKAIVIQIIFTIIVTLFYFFCSSMLNDLLYFMLLIFMSSNYLSLVSTMAYFCYIIEQCLSELEKEFRSLQQLPNILKQLLVIQSYVKQFDQFYNKYLFFIITFYCFECVCNLTILYFDRFLKMPWAIASIYESLSSIFIFCYLSDKINKSYVNVINKYEQLQLKMLDSQLGQFNHCLVSRLYSLRDDMCFTAFNLYPINMKTFMSIFSMIVTFTVILIQTRD